MTDQVRKEVAKRLLKMARKVVASEDEDSQEAAERLLKMARNLVAVEEEEEDDPRFIEKIRNLKKRMSKLSSKKRRKLNQYGIGIIKGNNTVEDLVDALSKVIAG